MLELAYALKIKVIFASTSEIYGKNNNLPFHELSDRVLGAPSLNRWCYATAKALDEHLCFAYRDMGLRVTILRYFNAYGPRQTNSQYGGVVARFIRAALSGSPIEVHGDGNQTRCFTYVEDAVRGTVEALHSSADGMAINIGSADPVEINQLAALVKSLTGSRSPIIYKSYDEAYGPGCEDMQARIPDISLAKKVLSYQPSSVSVIDETSSGNYTFVNSAARFYQASINSDACEDIILTEQPELIVHLAAQSDVQISVKNPSLDAYTNTCDTARLLTACHKACVKKIIYSSTSAVYGDLQKEIILESDPTSPVSYYGLTKLTGERYIQLFSKLYGLDYTILRFANVYGPRQMPKGEGGVVAIFIDSIRKGLPLHIFGDGNQTRDFVYVKDVVKAILAAANQGNGRVLHVSTGQCTIINELADHLVKIADRPLTINYLSERKGDIRHSCLLNQEISKYLNWRPAVSLSEGLRCTYSATL